MPSLAAALVLSFGAATEALSRANFPAGFVFGTASSAFQFEGAVNEGRRGDSIWDTFARRPGRILDFSNADVAVDQYHRYKPRAAVLLSSLLNKRKASQRNLHHFSSSRHMAPFLKPSSPT